MSWTIGIAPLVPRFRDRDSGRPTAGCELRAEDLRFGFGQSTIPTLRPIVARDSIAPTISGSAEKNEVEPAIGRIVPAAIILKSSSWSRTPSACDGKFNPVARLNSREFSAYAWQTPTSEKLPNNTG